MRPSKNLHLLTQLRHELGYRQTEVAERIGVKPDTIHRIETGRRKLTRRLAEKISDAFDVDPDCLIENDLARGLRTREGRPWTKKTRFEIQDRFKRWGNLEPYARAAQRGIAASLLYEYLEISHLIRSLPQPEYGLVDWAGLFHLAKSALIYSQPAARNSYKTPHPLPSLDTILDDIQAIQSDLRLIKRIEKRAPKKQLPREDESYWRKLSLARHFGWNERGLVAAQLDEELGEQSAKMPFRQFAKLVNHHCEEEGIPVPEFLDPYEAIVAWENYFRSRIRRTPKR